MSRASMNSGDVFILDADAAIYLWNGSASNAHERSKAADIAHGMAAERGGGVRVITVPDDEPDEEHPFWKLMPGERRFLGIKCVICTSWGDQDGRPPTQPSVRDRYADIKVRDMSAGGADEKVKAFQPLLMRLKVRLYDVETPTSTRRKMKCNRKRAL